MEKKFTDNEIIKALECCSTYTSVSDCKQCPLRDTCEQNTLDTFALDLINRQKAEIERLNVELVGMRGACESYKIHYDNAKAEIAELQRQLQEGIDLSDTVLKIVKSEARKEFAELIKQSTTDKSIDELLEEMEGESVCPASAAEGGV